MKVVHDHLQLLGQPVDDRDTLLVSLAIIENSKVGEVSFEDPFSMLFFELLQSFIFLVSLSLPYENG